jgi:hypothetical protein
MPCEWCGTWTASTGARRAARPGGTTGSTGGPAGGSDRRPRGVSTGCHLRRMAGRSDQRFKVRRWLNCRAMPQVGVRLPVHMVRSKVDPRCMNRDAPFPLIKQRSQSTRSVLTVRRVRCLHPRFPASRSRRSSRMRKRRRNMPYQNVRPARHRPARSNGGDRPSPSTGASALPGGGLSGEDPSARGEGGYVRIQSRPGGVITPAGSPPPHTKSGE